MIRITDNSEDSKGILIPFYMWDMIISSPKFPEAFTGIIVRIYAILQVSSMLLRLRFQRHNFKTMYAVSRQWS